MSTITPTIVSVNATVTQAPTASTLQQSGAIISLGGTTLTANSYQYCGNLTAVTSILSALGNFQEVSNMAKTFFAQGSAVGLYVLELGTQSTPANAIAALTSWMTANPGVFYAFLTPANWDGDATDLNTLAASYSGNTAKTYFFITTSSSTISAYSATNKSLFAVCPSPTAASTEFPAAAFFYQWLANNPAAASPAAPMAFRYLKGVTPWAPANNQTTIDTILTAYGNIVYTGAEGGISTAIIQNGTTIDGNQAMFWYAVDWILINAKLNMAAAVINGSNSTNPLYYNQTGINRLLAVANQVCTSSVKFGLCLDASTTATPFTTYTQANPSDYAAGKYNGFDCTATPQNGFLKITFNLDVTQFAA